MYHTQSIEQIIQTFNTSESLGLNHEEAEKRLVEFGPNALPDIVKDGLLKKLLSQFSNILVIVLIVAAIVSFLLGERLDAYVIGLIVLLNAGMGYIQESRAEKAIEALKALATSYAKVLRNGSPLRVDSTDLVPGDVIIIETGDKIPADARLIEAINLEVSEAILTGESTPVKKDTKTLIQPDLPLGDRINIIYKDTSVIYGRGKAIVMSTGKNTEIGKISTLLQKKHKEESPLSLELNIIGQRLSLLAGILILIIFSLGVLTKGFTLKESFFTSVSLAVAAIPEGLPAIITVVLAIGMSRLAKSKAIIRRLSAVETLGSTNYILTDKTGTLTQNQMTVTNIAFDHKNYVISFGKDFLNDKEQIIDPLQDEELAWLLKAAVLCNDAQECEKDENCIFLGDSTEVALAVCAKNAGLKIGSVRNECLRIFEIPFNSTSKKMLVVVKHPTDLSKVIVLAKGATESIQKIVTTDTSKITHINNSYAKQGLRSLAFSSKELSLAEYEKAITLKKPEEILATGHVFLGIIAQKDPLRVEVKDALLKAKLAGVNTIMLTGDHKLTATNIALELGLIQSPDEAIDGNELGNIDNMGLSNLLDKIKVFARVSPEQKLWITEILKSKGNIVAVTGDGVNDAPAIKTANIGISMGISGTDVSKEVSDMILQDDNYATIIEAIRQGRIVYDNLVKFIRYLISTNIAEILVVGISVFIGLPLPLLPIQILWLNLVSDGLPALSLGLEPGEKDIMHRAPRKNGETLLNTRRWLHMSLESFIIASVTIGVFYYTLNHYSLAIAQSTALTTLAITQLFHAFNNRSERHSIFSKNLEFNKYLVLTLFGSILLQVSIIYTSIGNLFTKTTALPLELFLASISIAVIPVVFVETYKVLFKLAHIKY